MHRLTLVIGFLLGCSGPSGREYCERWVAAWERAFPGMPQTADQRKGFVDSCTKEIANERAAGEFDHRLACLEKHVTGRGDATEEYQAMITCESGGRRSVGAGTKGTVSIDP